MKNSSSVNTDNADAPPRANWLASTPTGNVPRIVPFEGEAFFNSQSLRTQLGHGCQSFAENRVAYAPRPLFPTDVTVPAL